MVQRDEAIFKELAVLHTRETLLPRKREDMSYDENEKPCDT